MLLDRHRGHHGGQQGAGIRAALCVDAATAAGARKWNDANVLGLSLRLLSEPVATEIVHAWLDAEYTGSEGAQPGGARRERGAVSARRSVLQRRALLVGAAAVLAGCGHREEDPEPHHGYDPVPPPCRGGEAEATTLGVTRVAGDAGAGVTVLRIRPDARGTEIVDSNVRWTVVDGLVQLSVPAKVEHVAVSFAWPKRFDCDRGAPAEFLFEVALVPRDDELSVRSR